jgi:Rieske Fe-S protein
MTTGPRDNLRPSRRGVLLGAGLVSLGGAMAGCSTAAVPYTADEAGVVPQDGGTSASGRSVASAPAASAPAPAPAQSMPAQSMPAQSTPTASKPAQSKPPAQGEPAASKPAASKPSGTVLGAASEIPVGGGKIYTAARVVVTQPTSGQYKAFSAVCTHVGCIMSQVANGTIDCPCHGSEFKITNGAVVTGPAPSPLPPKRITVTDGKVVLI